MPQLMRILFAVDPTRRMANTFRLVWVSLGSARLVCEPFETEWQGMEAARDPQLPALSSSNRYQGTRRLLSSHSSPASIHDSAPSGTDSSPVSLIRKRFSTETNLSIEAVAWARIIT